MEFIEQLLTWWQLTVVMVLILMGGIINLFDVRIENRVNFKYKEMPTMKPITIPTKGKGFWGAIWMWITSVRTWEITKDFRFEINDQKYVIPKGFVFDGASVPKILTTWLSPVGVLLIGGLIHDYMYRCGSLLKSNKKNIQEVDQKKADEIFRDINIEVNGFYLMNYLAYYALRIGGFVAWNKHRNH